MINLNRILLGWISALSIILCFSRIHAETQIDKEKIQGVLTMEKALNLALKHNPVLSASGKQMSISQAALRQAGLWPNPELEVELEEFGGTDELQGVKAAEASILLSQELELGGKRSKRIAVADKDSNIAQWNYESTRQDILAETMTAFIQVVNSQDRLALSEEIVRLNEKTRNIVKEKTDAGAVSALELVKAEVNLAQSELEYHKSSARLAVSRKKLTAMWGNVELDFQKVVWDLEDVQALPSEEQLLNDTIQNPDLARWSEEIELKKAIINLEKSERIPNLTLGGGISYFNESNDSAFVVSLGLPLPLFNRNQGNIQIASLEKTKALQEREAEKLRTMTELAEVYQSLEALYEEISSLRKSILPGAETAYAAAQEGYQEGKFEYLDVLDAQKTFFETRKQYLQSLTEYHLLSVTMKRLTGSIKFPETLSTETISTGEIKDE